MSGATLTDASRITPTAVYCIDGLPGFVAYPADGGLYLKSPGAASFEFAPFSAIQSGKLVYTSSVNGQVFNHKLKDHHS